jgi:uncharacterized protein
MTKDIEQQTAHRPWPLPDAPWIMFQSWQDLLFAHWRLPAAALESLVPRPLAIDLFEGHAYVGIAPFRVAGLRARGLPALPGLADFQELNCRTYVRHQDRTGVFFFSLDASSRAAVFGARAAYRLPYHRADMHWQTSGDWIDFRSRRHDDDAIFEARYRPVGPEAEPVPGTLDHFLTERYALFVVDAGDVLRTDIHHRPWRLRRGEAVITRNTVAAAAGISIPEHEPILHFAAVQDTLVWAPQKAT